MSKSDSLLDKEKNDDREKGASSVEEEQEEERDDEEEEEEGRSWKHILSLPMEMLVHIAGYVGRDDGVYFALTCTAFYHAIGMATHTLRTPWRAALLTLPRLHHATAHALIPTDRDDERVALAAARGGSVAVLTWAVLSAGYSFDPHRLIQHAARGGDIECVSLCVTSLQIPLDESVCMEAAGAGHLPLLRFLHDSLSCPWDRYTCASAARAGHLHCLEYAWEHGCVMDKHTSLMAIEGNHLHILKVPISSPLS